MRQRLLIFSSANFKLASRHGRNVFTKNDDVRCAARGSKTKQDEDAGNANSTERNDGLRNFDSIRSIETCQRRCIAVAAATRRIASAKPRRRRAMDSAHEPSQTLKVAKRVLDMIGASVGLIVFGPLMIGIAIAINRTSPGPVLFQQKRYGYHNRRFWIYKFRTMYVHLEDQRGTRQTTNDDPRVTPLGRICARQPRRIAATHQRLQRRHVAGGAAAARARHAGRRHALRRADAVFPAPQYAAGRHRARANLRIPRQHGRPDSAIERLDCDLRYIEAWSFWLDLRIIVGRSSGSSWPAPAISVRSKKRINFWTNRRHARCPACI